MPETGNILWGIIAGSFGVLLLIVGWFLKDGASSMKEGMKDLAQEVKGLRLDLGRYHDSEMETKATVKAHIEKCEERHRHPIPAYALTAQGGHCAKNP